MPGGRDRVLATVGVQRTTDLVARLIPVAQVVAESSQHGTVGPAFQVAAFPSVLKVAANGRGLPVVTEARVDLDRRPSPAV
ncbi:hypothetical protein [Streptomyces sp. H27-D2]|uniref:hypothetical protein n=1 Tax=Streptomyces sp. H27-D2 TaxID=3046304 RepID=UPI002DBD57D2|nr:hypothetical protein [Streptomyces sp. H27-D2]MEC4016327.1 hypothetical protein [Streptomyces sp. H27-D2]